MRSRPNVAAWPRTVLGQSRTESSMSVIGYVVLTVAMFALLGLVQKLVEDK
ncbi:MAG: hypothetical protein ACSLE6_07975 [Mycobacterium sp.]